MAYNTAMPSGYDYEFVQEVPDGYICAICHLVMRKPVQTKCGHRFCKECLEVTNNSNPHCPVDRQTLTPQQIFEDTAWERDILSFKIKCTEKSCDWTGELRNFENHENECSYKIVDCDNESCNVRKPRCEMVGHVRDDCLYRIVSCPHCMNAYTFGLLEEHTSECTQCPVSCPNMCGETIKREQVTSHTSTECPLTIVPCCYQNIGCTIKVPRKDLNDHIDYYVKQHLAIAIEHNLSLQKQIDEMKKQFLPTNAIQGIEKQIDEMKKQIPPTNAIQGIQKQIDDVKRQLRSCNTIRCNRKHMDDMCCSFVWNVNDFSEQLETAKQSGRDIKLYSEPFYSHKYGYKLKLRLYPNGQGEGKGTHVSVYLIIMRGEYDALLTWPFDWKRKFILIDQKPNPSQRKNIEDSSNLVKSWKALQRPKTDENPGVGFPQFESHETLATENYVVDGTLFIKLELEKI